MAVDLSNKESKEEDKMVCTMEILNFIGWKYHESQQKPKERGSAEFNLKDLAEKSLEGGDEVRVGQIKQIGNSDEFEIIDRTEEVKRKMKSKQTEEVKK